MLEAISAWPTPADLGKAGRARIDAKLKSKGAKRHAAWAKAITDAPDKQTVVVAGTDAAGVALPHQLAALHAQRNDVTTQVQAPAGGPPSFRPIPTTRARYRGPGRNHLPGRNPRTHLPHGRPAGLPHPD